MSIPWQEVGRYNPESQSFTVERIPRPPEARAIVETSFERRSTLMGWELRHACPHCLKSVVLRWQNEVDEYEVRHAMARPVHADDPAAMAMIAEEAMKNATASAEARRHAERTVDRQRQQIAALTRDYKRERSRSVKSQSGAKKKRRGW